MSKMKSMFINAFMLQLFAEPYSFNTNVTTQTGSGQDMSPTMKVFYDTALLENARASLIFNQFADKQKMKGNKVEWRKFNTFDKALTPLTEGVTPTGKKFGMSKIDAVTTQHGDYTAISDRLELESYDDVIYGATEEMGAAAGATYDTLTRNILIQSTNVMYAPKSSGTAVTSLTALDTTCIVNPAVINKAATKLKKALAPKINGGYVALVHPSVSHDIRESAEWKEYHKYNDVSPIFKGEIGEMHGIRFVESTECPVIKGAGSAGTTNYYITFILGANAYGVLDPEGESMEMIIKQRGQIGGPLELYSTIGYKFCHGAKILYPERIIALYSCSSFSADDEPNFTVA